MFGASIGGGKVLRKDFTLNQPIANIDRARSYIGSLSIIELRMNGKVIGENVFGPRKPQPEIAGYYNTYDILPLLREGANTIGIMTSGINSGGDSAKGAIKIYYKDGTTQLVATDLTWYASNLREITRETLSSGEDIDANLITNWDTPEYEMPATGWTKARFSGMTSEDGQLHLTSNMGIFYTKQSFSGDYTIEAKVTVISDAFGLVFGNGNPNGALWQFNVIDGNKFKYHMPGSWSESGSVTNAKVQFNTPLTMKVELDGNTIKTYLDGDLIDTRSMDAARKSGPIGLRAALNEDFFVDYVKVTDKSGNVLFEDNFDIISSSKWNFTVPRFMPSNTGNKVIKEYKPVSVNKVTSSVDKTKPHTSNGAIVFPTNCGTFTTKQSFSGDITIEVRAKSDNVVGFLFGNGSPYPPMWQMSGSTLRLHQPGNWSSVAVVEAGIDTRQMTEMKIEVVGTTVKTYTDGVLKDTRNIPAGSMNGPLGFRVTVAEDCAVDYVRVIQGGNVVWEDNFDTIDSAKWNGLVPQALSESYVVDFGQNMQGYVKLETKGNKGDVIKVKYAEMLNSDGTIFANTTFHEPYHNFTLSGGDDVFVPRFSYTGFKYIDVSGDIENLDFNDFTACFISEDIDITGSFESSNERLNKIYDMSLKSQLSNMIGGVYTDCPQREKNGWTGDAAVTKESSALMLNDYTIAEAYIQSMIQSIRPDGYPIVIVPWPEANGIPTPYDTPWASAYFIFPYETYMQTGDRYYIDLAWDSLVKIFEFYKTQANNYLITFNTYGDWLGYDNQDGLIDRGFLSATYYYFSGMLLAKMAEVTGRDHTELDAYMSNMRARLISTYGRDNVLRYETTAGMFLDFDIPNTEESVAHTLDLAVQAVKRAGYTMRTGVLGTKSLYDALSNANKHKELLDTTINPNKYSFGFMLDSGATTLWEYWDTPGYNFNSWLPAGGVVKWAQWDSLNHTMFGGGPVTWMYKGLAGITQTAAAYKQITFRPGIESELSYAKGSVDTVIGKVVSNWENNENGLVWDITVPVNAQAKIIIPISDLKAITESGQDVFKKDGDGLKFVGIEDGAFVYTAGSGTYHFVGSYTEDIKDIDVTLGVSSIVEGLAANIPVSVDPAFDGAVVSFAGAQAVIENGTAVLKVASAPSAGDYTVNVKFDDSTAGSAKITVTEAMGLWAPVASVNADGKLVITFGAQIGGNIKTDKGVATANGNALTVDFSPEEDGQITISGVKYPDLFPSYSFKFTVKYSVE